MGGEKKVTVYQPSILQNQPGWPQGEGGERAPLGRWPGAGRGWGRERRGLPYRRGLIVLMGGVQKARQKSGAWGAGQASAFSTRAQCWRGHGATACPPLALGEPVAHEPLARQAPSGTRTTAAPPTAIPVSRGPPGQPPQNLGLSYTSLPSNMLQTPHLGARAAGRTAGWRVGVGGWVVQLLPPLKIQKKKKKISI